MSRRAAYPVQVGLLAGVYYVLGEAGLSAGALTGNVTPVWPPTGLALAALVLFGRRLWPGVLLGALLVNGLSALPLFVACGMAVGNTLEAVLGASLLGLVPGFRPSLERVADVVAVALLAAGLSTTVSASVGVTSLTLGGVIDPGAFWATWQVWWVGDALGALVVMPAILTWARPDPFRGSTSVRLMGFAIVVGLVGVTLAAFSDSIQRPYLVFPLLICAALLLRQPGATAATLVVSSIAVVLTVEGVGPFVMGTITNSLWALDAFLAVVALTTLMLAAVVSERDRADREARMLAVQLRYLADTDPLTGLGNRRSFETELERHVAQVARYGAAGALLVLDIDHFKQVNDSLGHRAGDDMITALTDVLRSRLRDTDVICRLGGDEFAVILPFANRAEAAHVADILVEAVRNDVSVLAGHQVRRVTVSIGMAMFDTPGLGGEDMLVQADLAMYQAKQAGRDRTAGDHSAPDPRANPQVPLTGLEWIAPAVENNQFVLHAQPILNLHTDIVDHYELLLRLIRDDGELVTPAAFLPAAERAGLVSRIDRWVIDSAINLVGEQPARPNWRFEVNLSGPSVVDIGLPGFIESRISRAGIDPGRLIFEVTETAVATNINLARQCAHSLRDIGCKFALDHLPADFNNVPHLSQLPFDYVKIDSSFITECVTTPGDQILTERLHALTQGLDVQTIGEFVANQATVALLKNKGLDYAQGYFIGRPVPLAEALVTSPTVETPP